MVERAVQVHVIDRDEGAFVTALRSRLPADISLTVGPEPPEGAEGRKVEVLVSGRPAEEALDALPALRWLVIPFAGVPAVTRGRLASRPGIAVANLHHNAAATAETAIGLLLAAAKTLVPADRALRAGDWSLRYDNESSVLLAGRRALVLGYGAIGRRVADVLLALGLTVEAVVRDPARTPAAKVPLHPLAALDARLPGADVVVVTLPDTDETRGLLDARRLGRLPHRSVLVNVGRGPVVDEAALFAALRDGPLGAAGIDVWYRYPESEEERKNTAPGDHPFGELDNLVLSPHRAGHAVGIEELRADDLTETLAAIARGDDPPHVVDLQRGY